MKNKLKEDTTGVPIQTSISVVQLKEQIVQMLLDRLADEYTDYYFYL